MTFDYKTYADKQHAIRELVLNAAHEAAGQPVTDGKSWFTHEFPGTPSMDRLTDVLRTTDGIFILNDIVDDFFEKVKGE